LDPYDIAGHYIRFKFDKYLQITGLPLGSYTSLAGAASLKSVNWLSQWRSSKDNVLVEKYFPLKTCTAWDCPLRRRFFWSAQDPDFRPYYPNPLRTQKFYENVLHPTIRLGKIDNSLINKKYQTRNGFCLCYAGDSCQPSTGNCSAQETIKSLTDFQFREAEVLHTDCNIQTDWPYTGGVMRDESSLQSKTSSCGVLNRLATFSYRYKNSEYIANSEKTTLDEGGDCHMGRPATYSVLDASCVLLEKKELTIVLKCSTGNVTLSRPKSGEFTVSQRTKCSQCDSLPKFTTPNGTILSENEVSYGKLWRWAPSRMLAQDLRFRLCGNDTECPDFSAPKIC
jgi:hypothetical protein